MRVYGFCLQPPTVVIVMELLCCSLSERLGWHARAVAFRQHQHQRSASCTEASATTATSSTTTTATTANHTHTAHHPGAPASSAQPLGAAVPVGSQASQVLKEGAGDALFVGPPASDSSGRLAPALADAQLRPRWPNCSGLGQAAEPAQGELSLTDVLRIGRDVAAGLAFLHEQQVRDGALLAQQQAGSPAVAVAAAAALVVHRDLKPDNNCCSARVAWPS